MFPSGDGPREKVFPFCGSRSAESISKTDFLDISLENCPEMKLQSLAYKVHIGKA